MSRPLPDDLLKVPHRRDVPFARLTTLGVGGVCRWLFEPTTEAQAQAFVRACAREGLPWRILGGGSNLVVLGDVEEPVLRLAFPKEAAPGRAGASRPPPATATSALAEAAAGLGLSGLEYASGIPGSVGGAMHMNAGAYGRELVDVLVRYRFLTPEGELVEKAPEPGEFRYRWSVLAGGRVALAAHGGLAEGDPARIRALVADYRREARHQPAPGQAQRRLHLQEPARARAPAGSSTRPGSRACGSGDAEVSPEHGNFLVNHGARHRRPVRRADGAGPGPGPGGARRGAGTGSGDLGAAGVDP